MGFGVFNDPAGKDVVACGDGFDRVFADKKDAIAPIARRWPTEPLSLSGWAGPSRGVSGMLSLSPSDLKTRPSPKTRPRLLAWLRPLRRRASTHSYRDWRRKRTCEEYVRRLRLRQAGLGDQIPSHRELLEEFGVGSAAQRGEDSNGPCQGVNGLLAHDHVFDRGGRFISVNEKGEIVDDDRYRLPNDPTIVFPNGNASFPPVRAHFRFSDHLNTVTFDLVLPANLDECSERCQEAYAWADSVFFSGLPWHRVCQADNEDNNVNGRTDELGEPCWIRWP